MNLLSRPLPKFTYPQLRQFTEFMNLLPPQLIVLTNPLLCLCLMYMNLQLRQLLKFTYHLFQQFLELPNPLLHLFSEVMSPLVR